MNRISPARALSVLAVVACLALAFAAPVFGVNVVESQIATHSGFWGGYAVSDGKVVYSEDIGDPYAGPTGPYDLWHFDTATKTTTKLVAGIAEGTVVDADIDGDRVAYNRPDGLYLYDVVTKTDTKLATSLATISEPQIDYPYVVYNGTEGGTTSVFAYNLSTGTESRLASGKYPRISGTWVVYQDTRSGNTDVFAYDLSKNSERRVTSHSKSQTLPDISGTLVVWQDDRWDSGDIAMQDLLGGEGRRITTDKFMQSRPRIVGSKIVHSGFSMFDLVNSKKVTLSRNAEEPAWWPEYDGRNVVYSTGYESWDAMGLRYAQVPVSRVSARGPAEVAYNGKATIKGSVKTWRGSSLPGRTVSLQWSTNGYSWKTLCTTKTNSRGVYSFTSPGFTDRRYFRVKFHGDSKNLAEWSPVVKVLPRVRLSKPTVDDNTVTVGTKVKVRGTLMPHFRNGSEPVVLKAYHLENGTYVLKSTSSPVTVSDYRDYSRYARTVKLDLAGSWRIRAYHPADPKHAATRSDFVSVSVR